MSGQLRRVLTIAGSDPSGGAGVQADLRVFTALGVTGLSALTAVTVQNSHGVRAVHAVPEEVLYSQIEAIFEDCDVHAVKIGMLADSRQVRVVAQVLRRFRPPNVVLDPVLASTAGVPFLDVEGIKALLTELVPLADLVTPNIPELESLPEVPSGGEPPRFRAVRSLFAGGARAVLIKGGHLPGDPVDQLIRLEDDMDALPSHIGLCFSDRRVLTPHTHGTGCFLSSAIAAYLANDVNLVEAIARAKNLIVRALSNPVVAGGGRGYPDVHAAVREVGLLNDVTMSTRQDASVRKLIGSLYLVTDSTLRPDRSIEEIVAQALAGGATVIQLREKSLSTQVLVGLAKRLVKMAHEAGALLLVNDRVDVALAADVDGVHLGPDDMHPLDARRILGPDKLIGVSAGTVEEAVALAPFASYLGVGAIFGSTTKLDAGAPVGPERIREVRNALIHSPVPIVAIGGINANNIAEVARAGADSAAVVSAIISAHDMRAAAEEIRGQFTVGRVHLLRP